MNEQTELEARLKQEADDALPVDDEFLDAMAFSPEDVFASRTRGRLRWYRRLYHSDKYAGINIKGDGGDEFLLKVEPTRGQLRKLLEVLEGK